MLPVSVESGPGSGYAGTPVDWARTTWRIGVDIVRKLADQITFIVLPRHPAQDDMTNLVPGTAYR